MKHVTLTPHRVEHLGLIALATAEVLHLPDVIWAICIVLVLSGSVDFVTDLLNECGCRIHSWLIAHNPFKRKTT